MPNASCTTPKCDSQVGGPATRRVVCLGGQVAGRRPFRRQSRSISAALARPILAERESAVTRKLPESCFSSPRSCPTPEPRLLRVYCRSRDSGRPMQANCWPMQAAKRLVWRNLGVGRPHAEFCRTLPAMAKIVPKSGRAGDNVEEKVAKLGQIWQKLGLAAISGATLGQLYASPSSPRVDFDDPRRSNFPAAVG